MEGNIRKPISFDNSLLGRKSIYFDIPGEPFAKQRPRAARKGRFVTVYTPKETRDYEDKVKKEYNKIYKNYPGKFNDSLTVEIEGIFEVHKSISKRIAEKMLSGEIDHTKKPDCDNMGKICLDALNGIAYNDDASINKLIISKKYGIKPMVRITIKENKTS